MNEGNVVNECVCNRFCREGEEKRRGMFLMVGREVLCGEGKQKGRN